jgi:type II secretory pathway pseudopilin PulG
MELMVSLSVVGVIAGLTVPTFLNTVEMDKRNALLKKTVAELETAASAAAFESPVSLATLFTNTAPKLSLVSAPTTAGVVTTATLKTGVTLTSVSGTGTFSTQCANFSNGAFLLDTNGTSGMNELGTDQFELRFVFSDADGDGFADGDVQVKLVDDAVVAAAAPPASPTPAQLAAFNTAQTANDVARTQAIMTLTPLPAQFAAWLEAWGYTPPVARPGGTC